MKWVIQLTKTASKTLSKFEQHDQKHMIESLRQMKNDPLSMDIKKIESSKNEWRLRVGNKRIRFTIDFKQRTITVLQILPRDKAYS